MSLVVDVMIEKYKYISTHDLRVSLVTLQTCLEQQTTPEELVDLVDTLTIVVGRRA